MVSVRAEKETDSADSGPLICCWIVSTAAAPGTIRGDLGRDWGLKVQQNLVHGDTPRLATLTRLADAGDHLPREAAVAVVEERRRVIEHALVVRLDASDTRAAAKEESTR